MHASAKALQNERMDLGYRYGFCGLDHLTARVSYREIDESVGGGHIDLSRNTSEVPSMILKRTYHRLNHHNINMESLVFVVWFGWIKRG